MSEGKRMFWGFACTMGVILSVLMQPSIWTLLALASMAGVIWLLFTAPISEKQCPGAVTWDGKEYVRCSHNAGHEGYCNFGVTASDRNGQ